MLKDDIKRLKKEIKTMDLDDFEELAMYICVFHDYCEKIGEHSRAYKFISRQLRETIPVKFIAFGKIKKPTE